MTEEAQEAALHFKRQVGEGLDVYAAFQVQVESAVTKARAAGVAEGRRQAREAVATIETTGIHDLDRAVEAIDRIAATA